MIDLLHSERAEAVKGVSNERIAVLEAGLRKLGKRAHNPRDCAIYTVPMSGMPSLLPVFLFSCDCGADAHNAEVEALLVGGGK